jgi:hypothetical protein
LAAARRVTAPSAADAYSRLGSFLDAAKSPLKRALLFPEEGDDTLSPNQPVLWV